MCGSGERSTASGGVASGGGGSALAAVGVALKGLGALAAADLACVPVAVQADCLRELARAEALLVAARARVLSAFDYNGGFKDDGQGTARTWLRWQTRITSAAASGAVGWMRRLRAHQRVAEALAAGQVSASWAREICDWTDRLPESARDDADAILLGAAAGGAELADLASLAEQMRQRLARPDEDKGRDDDCQVRLARTLGGAGKLDGDLSPRCAEALQAVLDSLGKKAGPEDDRTIGQRHHDALYEACRRLIGAKCLPDRAGQPVQLQVHISVEELIRRLGEHSGAEPGQPELPLLPGAPAGPGDECDASIVPIVTGCLDHDLLDKLTALVTGDGRPGDITPDGTPRAALDAGSVRDLIVANAAALFSGPRGLASWLRRTTLDGPAATISLPLDTGAASETVPPHLRRAVILRDRHCAAPGCDQPPAACQVHHIKPRRLGGATKLTNLLLLCTSHHLIAVHTWGFTIALNPDGTTTMTSPDGDRVYHSHSPPIAA